MWKFSDTFSNKIGLQTAQILSNFQHRNISCLKKLILFNKKWLTTILKTAVLKINYLFRPFSMMHILNVVGQTVFKI